MHMEIWQGNFFYPGTEKLMQVTITVPTHMGISE